jgi:hypothetical protein
MREELLLQGANLTAEAKSVKLNDLEPNAPAVHICKAHTEIDDH